MSVSDQIATPEGKRRYVRSLFATIADRYDLITVMLSFGLDRRWKRRLVNLAAPRPGDLALDLATGTGDIAFAIDGRCRRVVGLDVTPRMIELAKAKASMKRPRASDLPAFLVGDMIALPFPDASFDLVTTGYGLRNVPDLPAAIDEIRRVLKPGGRALSLDFNRPANALVRSLYLQYLTMVGGALGWILHGDPDTYRYIPASIRGYPGAAGVARLMELRGFTRVRYSRVLGGLMAIHQGYKPDET
jgi:demethylmenaquinone methyltransferase/2-methoxy-6-polyprenyl-1,4-benzoquinol methylase